MEPETQQSDLAKGHVPFRLSSFSGCASREAQILLGALVTTRVTAFMSKPYI